MQIDSFNLFNRKTKMFVRFFPSRKAKKKSLAFVADLVQF